MIAYYKLRATKIVVPNKEGRSPVVPDGCLSDARGSPAALQFGISHLCHPDLPRIK